MWRLALVALVGCGGPPSAAPRVVAPGPARPHAITAVAVPDRVPVDPIAALTPAANEDAEVSWLAPGQAQLELDGAPIENPGGGHPIEVTMFDAQGSRVRVAVRLDHARFSLWTDRNRLFGVLRRSQRVAEPWGGAGTGEVQATVKAGARVKRLAHRGDRTQIRYYGALEIEGWVPDAVLGDAGPPHEDRGRFPTGRQTLMVMPGAVIRSEPKWGSNELAVMANGYFLDTVDELEDGWVDVAYEDGDVQVRGFLSKQLPPGQVHRPHTDPEQQPVPITPNAKVASGTCLYARVRGEPVGYIVGDQSVELTDGEAGWSTLSIDSPWGPIAFAAKGPTHADLAACAPAGTVPPPAPPSAPPPATSP